MALTKAPGVTISRKGLQKRVPLSVAGSMNSLQSSTPELQLNSSAYYLVCKGDKTGPRNPALPDWLEGLKGPFADRGIWHPFAVEDGAVYWAILVWECRKPTATERLAFIAEYEDE